MRLRFMWRFIISYVITFVVVSLVLLFIDYTVDRIDLILMAIFAFAVTVGEDIDNYYSNR